MTSFDIGASESNAHRTNPDINTGTAYTEAQWYGRALERLTGIIAFGLPLVLLLFWSINDTCPIDSISHSYFRPGAGDIFLISLAIVGTVLLAYRGENAWEKTVARVGGIAAFGVAVFPTGGRGCQGSEMTAQIIARLQFQPGETAGTETYAIVAEDVSLNDRLRWFDLSAYIGNFDLHYLSAGILFIALTILCYSFMKAKGSQKVNDMPTTAKRNRNMVYLVCLVSMIICLGMLVLYVVFSDNPAFHAMWVGQNLTFWFELWALFAFGIAWIVRGRLIPNFPGFVELRDPRDEAAVRHGG